MSFVVIYKDGNLFVDKVEIDPALKGELTHLQYDTILYLWKHEAVSGEVGEEKGLITFVTDGQGHMESFRTKFDFTGDKPENWY